MKARDVTGEPLLASQVCISFMELVFNRITHTATQGKMIVNDELERMWN
jgi:hypothetical protein